MDRGIQKGRQKGRKWEIGKGGRGRNEKGCIDGQMKGERRKKGVLIILPLQLMSKLTLPSFLACRISSTVLQSPFRALLRSRSSNCSMSPILKQPSTVLSQLNDCFPVGENR